MLAWRKFVEKFWLGVMIAMLAIAIISVLGIIGIVLWRGFGALSFEMFFSLKFSEVTGEPVGIANSIIGSAYLAGGGVLLACLISIPLALVLQREYLSENIITAVTVILDVLWGIPSIVYGAIGYLILMSCHQRASLLGGIVTLALLSVPIMTRAAMNVISLVPVQLRETSYGLGATRWETISRVIFKQALPGMATAVMLAFGRAIGDTAAVLFTAGYSDKLPRSIMEGAASLPITIYYKLMMPGQLAQRHAYAASFVLIFIVLVVSAVSRTLSNRLSKYTVK